MYKTEEYKDLCDIRYIYALSDEERNTIRDIIDNVVNTFESPKETIPFVTKEISSLNELFKSLELFFNDNPGDYFIRISTCSPKDARYYLTMDRSNNDSNDDVTIEDIINDLQVLKVNDPLQCILVICHSMRIFFEVQSEQSIILMPWKNNILYDTETRCFIKNSKLIGFSQYYCDLSSGYTSIFNDSKTSMTVSQFCNGVLNFISMLIMNKKIPYSDAVVDIVLSTGPIHEYMFIEINPFNIGTDSCLFDWKHLSSSNPNLIFVYKVNDGRVVVQL